MKARVHRRLTAILAADVVGHSRLTSADEEGTLAQLKLASTFSLTRYDARGNRLSDWGVGEVSLDA